jgi:hypothetical protein
MLQRAGLPVGTPPERWVYANPAPIVGLHQAYVEAGADVILTCTFGGTLPRLSRDGLDAHADEINRRAVELARQAAGTRAFVAGDIGPTGELLAPWGTLLFEDAVAIFARQAAALAQGGADLFQIETMSDLEEVRAAVEGARRAAPDLPIFVTMSFDSGGRTMMGGAPGGCGAVAQFAGSGGDGVELRPRGGGDGIGRARHARRRAHDPGHRQAQCGAAAHGKWAAGLRHDAGGAGGSRPAMGSRGVQGHRRLLWHDT